MHLLEQELRALASHMGERRDAILDAWRGQVRRDPELASGKSLPRAQLDDHVPAVLMAFEDDLAQGATDSALTQRRNRSAAAHGLHRWQQGYDLREVVRELGALNVCVVAELDAYAQARPGLDLQVLATARRRWAVSCSTDIEASTAQYFQLQQTEAEGHVRDLEKALQDLRELERQRAALWQQAAHDLRGNVGVVSNATAGLAAGTLQGEAATLFMGLLQRNVASLRHLLDDVTGLARLQAGREERQLSHFDVATVLSELCEGLSPFAQERNLSLRCEGPCPFPVQGDSVKVRRLAQNLVLNSIKYTLEGGVTVRWGDGEDADAKRWTLTVADTGPGFHAGPGAPLADALQEATDLAEDGAHTPAVDAGGPACGSVAATDKRPVNQEHGEGIGLSIVKRLAELLDASVELESVPNRGTTFRILLPRRY
ncbi:MAG: sensor histidine kinase [Burkholderiaceae bacterium]